MGLFSGWWCIVWLCELIVWICVCCILLVSSRVLVVVVNWMLILVLICFSVFSEVMLLFLFNVIRLVCSVGF